ncbi:hypothetical protein H4R21_001545 [Coemansia helicoidea]|uniref:Uncharacterized protein n=1 Tax=Coemansia helicoidea TaxID=1286919 RepID=A0ACC1LC98_9FUNG|nr:hypothetical protein H4R21_001545 [Coemansia helicoidea]
MTNPDRHGPFAWLPAHSSDDDAHVWLVGVDEICAVNQNVDRATAISAVDPKILADWAEWRKKGDGRSQDCEGLSVYLRVGRNPRNSRAQKLQRLLELPTTTNIVNFNRQFQRLVDDLGWGDDKALIGAYLFRLPRGLHSLVLTQPPSATLGQVMDVVASRVNADALALGSSAMDIDGVDFGWVDASRAHAGALTDASNGSGGGKRRGKPSTPKERYDRLIKQMRDLGISDDTINDRANRKVCLRCGNGGHQAGKCHNAATPGFH